MSLDFNLGVNNSEAFKQRFESDFQKLLIPDNTFYLNTKGISSSDLSVNIPQYLTQVTGPADVHTTGPLDIQQWSEDNKVVTQSRFRTIAYAIDDYKAFFLAQDLRLDAMLSIKNYLDTAVGNYAAFKMSSTKASTQVFTTGSGTTETFGQITVQTRPSSAVGSTATVKRITQSDMLKVKTLMSKSNMIGKWCALLSPEQVEDLFSIAQFSNYFALGQLSKLQSGEFADILGIKIFMRAPRLGANAIYTNTTVSGVTTAVLNDAYNTVTSGNTVGVNDSGAAIFWNENALYANRGLMKTYIQPQVAAYQADLLSAQYTFGIDKIRIDEVGVIALIESLV
jgi:hypothetical protein